MKKTQEELTLIRIAESGTDEEAQRAMKELREKYDATYHWCFEWDEMVICSSDKEAEVCLCVYGNIS